MEKYKAKVIEDIYYGFSDHIKIGTEVKVIFIENDEIVIIKLPNQNKIRVRKSKIIFI